MVARFILFAASPARGFPTGTEPVKDICRTTSDPKRCSGTPAFLGKPFDNVGADEHLGAGFGNDLALLLRHQARDILRALAYQTCRLAQHLRAVIGACRAPDRKALIRGLERLVEVACGRMW